MSAAVLINRQQSISWRYKYHAVKSPPNPTHQKLKNSDPTQPMTNSECSGWEWRGVWTLIGNDSNRMSYLAETALFHCITQNLHALHHNETGQNSEEEHNKTYVIRTGDDRQQGLLSPLGYPSPSLPPLSFPLPSLSSPPLPSHPHPLPLETGPFNRARGSEGAL